MEKVQDLVFWFKNQLFRRDAVNEYQLSLKHLALDKEGLDKINWEKRKAIVEFSYNNSIFYHRFYEEHNFNPSDLHVPSDWEKVPILEKDMIRKYREEIRTIDKKYLRENTTSGSTGEPLISYHDSRFHQEILEWRMCKIWNVSPADNMAKVWRIPLAWSSFSHRLRNKLIWFPTKRIHLEATGVSPVDIELFVEKFNRQGGIINGYAGTIAEIARYIVDKNIHIIQPKLIVVFASPLSAVDKEIIDKAFHKANILDSYCCNEVSFIAFNCSQSTNLHINWDYRHVDIVKEDALIYNSGVMGDVLLTDLTNFGFPIIKYRIGDKSCWIKDECGCGCNCNLPQMAPIKGRISDHIMLPGHGFLSGEWLTTIFDDYPNAVKTYQIFQKEDFNIDLKIIPNKKNEVYKDEVTKVVKKLEDKTKGLLINVIEKDVIPCDRGKHRFIISQIKH